MRYLFLFTTLLFSFCCEAQHNLVSQFDSVLRHPTWEFNKQYHYDSLDFIHQDGFRVVYLQDSLLVAIAKEQWIPGNHSRQMDIEIVMSAKTGKVFWYQKVEKNNDWRANEWICRPGMVICKYADNLICNDLLTGKVLWKYPEGNVTPDAYISTFFSDTLAYLINPKGYIGQDTSGIYSQNITVLSLKTGRLVREIHINPERNYSRVDYVFDNKIILDNYNYPICIDAQTGNVLWEQKVERNGHPPSKTWIAEYFDFLGYYNDTLVYLIDTNKGYNYPGDLKLVVVNINTGQKRITSPQPKISPFGMDSQIKMDGRYLYWVYEKNDTAHMMKPEKVLHKVFIRKVNLSTGKEVWNRETGLKFLDNDRPPYRLLLDSDLIYFVFNNNILILDKPNKTIGIDYTWSRQFKQPIGAEIVGRFLMLTMDNDPNHECYYLLNNTHLFESSSNLIKMHILNADEKSNAYYIVDERGKFVKLQLTP